jgi:hypothetical protein
MYGTEAPIDKSINWQYIQFKEMGNVQTQKST